MSVETVFFQWADHVGETGERMISANSRNIIYVVIIAIIGLVAAIVCFGVLNSTGRVSQGYTVSGAIVGAVITWGIFGSMFLRFEASSSQKEEARREYQDMLRVSQERFDETRREYKDELETARRSNEELRLKLFRSAPRPAGFEVEVDERQRLVIGRPKEWVPVGNEIFNFNAPNLPDVADILPPNFSVSVYPTDTTLTTEEFFNVMRQRIINRVEEFRVPIFERISVGGEYGQVQGLKAIYPGFVEVLSIANSVETRRQYRPVSVIEFRNDIQRRVDELLRSRSNFLNQAEDLKAKKDFAEFRLQVCSYVERSFERGEMLPLDHLMIVQDNDGWHFAPVEDGAASTINGGPVSVDDAATDAGRRADPVGQARAASDEVRPSSSPERVVIPVRTMLVICRHERLEQTFHFQFGDDASGFMHSTATFNDILSSVRFLT
jgi:hypothetical protein